MVSCREYELDDLLAVTAIPVADFPLGTAPWQLKPTIATASFSPALSPALTHAIVVGLRPATSGGMLVPIRRLSGKAKDSEDDSVAGRRHSVTVTCDADDRDLTADAGGLTVADYLLKLERTPSHLLLTFRGGRRAFVAATKDTYVCEVERDGAKTGITFKVEDLMGIQLITA